MNKAIEKVETYKIKTIGNALTKAENDYKDTKDFYNQTGYDRYYKKLIRLDNEIQELKTYLEKDNTNERLSQLKSEFETEKMYYNKRLQEIQKDLLNRLFYLLKVVPDCSEARSLEAYIKNLE